MKYILRNTGTKVINLPSEIWKDVGWELNDEVELTICENSDSSGEEWLSITVERTKDLIKYDEDYPYKEEDEQ